MSSVWRNTKVGERHIATTLPRGVDVLEDQNPATTRDMHAGYLLKPSGLDQLEPGSYQIKTRLARHPATAMLTVHRQTVTVRQAGHGLVVAENSFGRIPEVSNMRPTQYKAVKPLLHALGHVCGEKGVVEIATPETFKRSAASHGLAIRLLRMGLIDLRTYLGTFREGEFPVAIGEESYYNHDNSDAHATGMLLGGVMLRTTLQGAADRVLSVGGPLNDAASAFDNYSFLIREAAVRDGIDNTRYFDYYGGATNATQAVVNEGLRAGIAEEASLAIIDNARVAAAKFGAPVGY